jgi:division protein CdvB (Snf7/Vps24/ESCRT-III family)
MNIKESIVLPMTMEEEYKNAGIDAGSLDLETRIERLEFRNEKLHQYVNKLIVENKQLREQLEKVVDQYRNKGDL